MARSPRRFSQPDRVTANDAQQVGQLRTDLRESAQRFEELVEHLHQVVWMRDATTGRFVYVSPAYERIWGRSCESLYERRESWRDAIHPGDRRRLPDSLFGTNAQGDYETEFRIIRPDGSVRWIWDRAYAVADEQSDTRRFVGVAEDITESKAAADQSAKLAAIIEYADDSIVSLTLNGIVTSWNQGAARLYGYSAEEMIGHAIFVLHPPEKYDEYYEIMGRAQKGERVAAFDTVRRRKDGSLVAVSLSASAVEVEPGHVTGTTKISHDISDIKGLEEQVRQAQKMEAVGRLAAGVAHDFNNLLTVISGYSEILLSRLVPDDPVRVMVSEIHTAGARAGTLTRQLLAFSRQQVLEPKVLDLNSVVADTESMLRRMIGEDVILTALLDPALKPVRVDPGQIQQVLMNLAVNARDAMPQGGRLTVETCNATLDEAYREAHPEVVPGLYSLLAFSDTGTGMDDETKARAFDPFFTTKELGRGTGLGLAVVHGIVKQSGGHIEVYSEPGHGTAFKVYFPHAEGALSSAGVGGFDVMPTGDETLLLVEDDDAVRALGRHVLQALGYNLLEASDGREALRLAQDHVGPIHLVVSDVVMPHLGGRQLAEMLEGVRPGVRVLFLSGYTDDAVIRHGILEADVAFLQKPFTPRALARKVRAVLDETK
jgi:two-component system cell cycle sensor histidine kinase/response regulator CckA